jgi:hypothetical protein
VIGVSFRFGATPTDSVRVDVQLPPG